MVLVEKDTVIESGSLAEIKNLLLSHVCGIIIPQNFCCMVSLSEDMTSSGEYNWTGPAQTSISTIYQKCMVRGFMICIILTDFGNGGSLMFTKFCLY